MNKTYYNRLLRKLRFHHRSIRDYGKEEVTITLTKAEIDDILYVWGNHAEKIFKDKTSTVQIAKEEDNGM